MTYVIVIILALIFIYFINLFYRSIKIAKNGGPIKIKYSLLIGNLMNRFKNSKIDNIGPNNLIIKSNSFSFKFQEKNELLNINYNWIAPNRKEYNLSWEFKTDESQKKMLDSIVFDVEKLIFINDGLTNEQANDLINIKSCTDEAERFILIEEFKYYNPDKWQKYLN